MKKKNINKRRVVKNVAEGKLKGKERERGGGK